MAVTDEAISRIKALIVNGQLSPGSRLPPEKDLANSLGLSRSSLREAVKALELIRVLDVRRGDGTYVTSLEPRLLLEAMSFVVDLHRADSVLEILEVRRILESRAARMAASRRTETDLTEIKSLLDSVEDGASIEKLVQHDELFHRAISRTSGNSYLAELLDSLSGATQRARVWRGVTQSGAVEQTINEHRAIFDAIERGDSDLAAALTEIHVSGVEQWLRESTQ